MMSELAANVRVTAEAGAAANRTPAAQAPTIHPQHTHEPTRRGLHMDNPHSTARARAAGARCPRNQRDRGAESAGSPRRSSTATTGASENPADRLLPSGPRDRQ